MSEHGKQNYHDRRLVRVASVVYLRSSLVESRNPRIPKQVVQRVFFIRTPTKLKLKPDTY